MSYSPCPQCGHGLTSVKDVRIVREPIFALRRRRQCGGCGLRYSTFEISEKNMEVTRLAARMIRTAGRQDVEIERGDG